MQQLLCCPTITCTWYSNLPSSHLASLRNVLCLWLCQFVFHFLPLVCISFTIPHLYLIHWDLPLSSSKLWVESWCKSISGYHLSNGLLSPLSYPPLQGSSVLDMATGSSHCLYLIWWHCFKTSLVFRSGSGLDFVSAGCWTQSPRMPSWLTSSPLFLLLVACIDTVTWRLRDVRGKRLAWTQNCWCQRSQRKDLTRTSLRFHPLGLNHLFCYHYYALLLCAQLPQEFRNFSQSLANPPSSSMPSLFSAKNCSV